MSINISDKYKCIFIHIPRVAGTSIKEALGLPGRGHLPWQYYYLVYPEQWDSYVKFAVVRNPWERVVSAYTYARMKKSYWHDNIKQIAPHPDYKLLSQKTFGECCEILRYRRTMLKHEAWYPQHIWITKEDNARWSLKVDLVLRHETIAHDFQILCGKLGIGNIELPRINPSNHENYRTCFTEETKKIIEEVYATDLELFPYEY